MVTRRLPGQLVLDMPYADDPDAYEQAGRLLAQLHAQPGVEDLEFEISENQKAFDRLEGPHRIDPDVVRRLRDEISRWPTPTVTLVPTHGDWQTRNWLIDNRVVRVIDLGRAALRPAMSDLTRLSAEDFRRRPALAGAFFRGYGPDPRVGDGWRRFQVREGIGTATFAYRIGNETFEAQGHRMISDALARRDLH
jgi:Ser/Thr protein kinase RdoA (MazF antagonist)